MRKMIATMALLSIVAFLFAASASVRTEAAQPDMSAGAFQADTTATAGRLCILRCNGTDTCGICCWKHDHWECS